MIHARNGERIIKARTVSVNKFSAFFSLPIFLVSMVFDLLSLSLFSIFVLVHCQSSSLDDASVMMDLRESLNSPSSLGWTDLDPCKWPYVNCSVDGRVTWIRIGSQNLTGYLPPSLANLTALQLLDVGSNNLGGSLPSLADGLSSLRTLLLSYNNFSSIPSDFFLGMTSLETVILDNNGFSPQPIPDSLRSASNLKFFEATACYFTGKIPDFLGFAKLTGLYLAFNNLEGGLPATFSGTSIRYLYLNSQQSTYKLNGSIAVIENMPNLMEVRLEANSFSGPLPDISGLTELRSLKVRDNGITGLVPASFLDHPSLSYVSLTNNLLQGPTPKFVSDVTVHMEKGSNSFCLSDPGVACDPRVNTLLSIAQSVGYPTVFAKNWKGNEPCKAWFGVDCQNGNITVINFSNLSLTGTISPNFSLIISLQILVLANNNLTGTIPNELTTLPNLRELDVSNNLLSGKIPPFKSNVVVNTDGNSNISTDGVFPAPVIPGTPLKTEVIVALVIGGFFVVLFVGILIYCLYRGKQKHSKDLQVIEVGHMAISIHVLKNATNNFGQENILGRGGFGTVYKGELHDGTKIAVKRMESGVVSERGWDQFESEIVVLSKVRHRHLVCLLGYCLDGNEKLLVYEYMPQGSLCRHLFRWKEEGLKPLEWLKRLTIALDVARGVEYLHGLAHQSFIHRDLKPSNILLGHDMRAKVADFGFVRLAPDGKSSVLTRLAGTFGYLAPEYAMTGRLTKKIDVFSFGVILMQLITGRKALVETQQDECIGLVSWFRKMCTHKDAFHKAIDTTINLDEETLASINTVAELAGHCCTKKPSQRPDMAHAVNVLSSLIEFWKPSDLHSGEGFGSSGELKPKDHSPAYPNEWL